MASTDSMPVPRKNVAYRIYFGIYKNDGTLITGATGLDSEVSKDGAAFGDCTNEATEIGSSGTYYLDLTSTEMNADNVMLVIKTTSTSAVIPTFAVYPQETGDIKVDVTSFGGTAGTFASGRPEVNTTHLAGTSQTARDIGASVLLSSGTGTGQVTLTSGRVNADITHISASAVTATGGRMEVNTTHWAGTAVGSTEVRANLINIAGAAVSTTTAQLGVNAVQISGDGTAADNLETAFDDTAGSVKWLGIIDQGTAQAATSTTLQLRSAAAFADDELIGATIQITGGTTGVGQARVITDYDSSTDTATVDAWTTTPTGTITYKIYGTAPASASSAPTAAQIADAVWDELLSGHAVSGSAGEALSAAGTAGDPWTTTLPGAYGAGTAGKIIGDNLNATVSSRATQTSVDTIDGIVDSILVDTAEIGAAGAGLTALASQTSVNTIDDLLDTEIPALTSELAKVPKSDGTATWNATALAAIQSEANDALVAYDPPTNAEMEARTLAAASYATATNLATVDTVVDAIKVKTDSLTFTTAGMVDAAIKRVGDTTLTAAGTGGQGYGAA